MNRTKLHRYVSEFRKVPGNHILGFSLSSLYRWAKKGWVQRHGEVWVLTVWGANQA